MYIGFSIMCVLLLMLCYVCVHDSVDFLNQIKSPLLRVVLNRKLDTDGSFESYFFLNFLN